MISLYLCRTDERHRILHSLLSRYGEIERTPNGKPYIRGNPVYFSVAHSGGLCTIAISSSPVGVDCELERGRTHKIISDSFCPEERAEIESERDFLEHWTAREAYTKLVGARIWDTFRRLSLTGGKLRSDGEILPEEITFLYERGAVICVCGDSREITVKQTD